MGKNVSAKFLKNLENLSSAGFEIVDESEGKSQDVKKAYRGYTSKIQGLQKRLERLQSKVNYKQRRMDLIELQIERTDRQMQRMKDKKGFFVTFSSSYKIKNTYLKQLKRQKKQLPREIKVEYAKIKANESELKGAYKELKDFEKYVNKLAKKHAEEIKFVSYYKKNRIKLQKIYGRKEFAKIRKCIQSIRDGQEWPYENMSIKECRKQMKQAVSKNYGIHFIKRIKGEIEPATFAQIDTKNDKNHKSNKLNENTKPETKQDRNDRQNENTKLDSKKTEDFQKKMFNSVIFATSKIDREAFKYMLLKSTGKNLNPEAVLLALGASSDTEHNFNQLMHFIENGTIAEVVSGDPNEYMKKGNDLIETMDKKDKEKLTTASEKIAWNLAHLYQRDYKEWEKQKEEAKSQQQNRQEQNEQGA